VANRGDERSNHQRRWLGTLLETRSPIVPAQNAPEPTAAAAPATAPSAGWTPLFERDQVLEGTYRILEVLATGGMGAVYVAAHARLPRKVAIKTLHPDLARQQEWVARFCREACVLAQLRHPNIVQVSDFNVSTSGVPFIAMELIDGVNLRAELDRGRRFDVAEALSIVRQISSALDAAHAAGVVHRDLKPENVVITPAAGQLPVVKVIDFGLSISESLGRVTGSSTIFGTPEYMAPEQAQGARDQIDGRTDQFALAALTYTLVSGRPPFQRDTPVAVLYAVVHEDPAPLAAPEGWDIAPVERVLRRGMARDREDRYPSVLAFVDALEEAFIQGGAMARPTPSAPLAAPVEVPARRTSKRKLRSRRGLLLRRAPFVLVSMLLAGLFWLGFEGSSSNAGAPASGWRSEIAAIRRGVAGGFRRVGELVDDSPAQR
jgi:serine/threonine protein kinase